MLALAASLLLQSPPWAAPVKFAPRPGWRTGASGTVQVVQAWDGQRIRLRRPISTAWIANVPYRDPVTADPPARTLDRLAARGRGVVAYVLIEQGRDPKPFRRDLRRARHFLCCDGSPPSSYVSDWELSGHGPRSAYRVIVRIYLPVIPRAGDIRAASVALGALRLPRPR
jgi:hypothetical protein